jgi:hypothetical protein
VKNRRVLRRSGLGVLIALLAMALALQVGVAEAKPEAARTFVAPLSGGQEVPPNDSRATGVAVFKLSKDGTALDFRVNVGNIENVTQAHIHLAPVGVNGPVVVWLHPPGPPAQLLPGRTNGPLAQGTITAADLVGQLAGEDLATLVAHIRDGNAYVNVHTTQFPPGEVRGQIR